MQGAPSSRQNPLDDSTEFYVQCAIKFLHEHENFRWKPLKGNERERIGEGKGRGPAWKLCLRPRVPSYATANTFRRGIPCLVNERCGVCQVRVRINVQFNQHGCQRLIAMR